MQLIAMIIVILCIVIMCLSIGILIRNQLVFNFRNWVIEDLVFRDMPSEGWEIRLRIFKKVEYTKMVLSLKKLQIENFYSLEDCHILSEGLLTS